MISQLGPPLFKASAMAYYLKAWPRSCGEQVATLAYSVEALEDPTHQGLSQARPKAIHGAKKVLSHQISQRLALVTILAIHRVPWA